MSIARKPTMPGHLLRHEIQAVTTQIAGRRKVVVFQGREAKTDNTRIFLPAMNNFASYGLHDANVMRGYAVHEASHCRYTDWKVFERSIAETAKTIKGTAANAAEADALLKFYAKLSNLVDDRFIEACVTLDYPGTTRWLSTLRCHAAGKRLEQLKNSTGITSVETAFMVALLSACDLSNNWPCVSETKHVLAIVEGAYPEITDLVPSWIEALHSIQDGADVYRYAHQRFAEYLLMKGKVLEAPSEEASHAGSQETSSDDADADEKAAAPSGSPPAENDGMAKAGQGSEAGESGGASTENESEAGAGSGKAAYDEESDEAPSNACGDIANDASEEAGGEQDTKQGREKQDGEGRSETTGGPDDEQASGDGAARNGGEDLEEGDGADRREEHGEILSESQDIEGSGEGEDLPAYKYDDDDKFNVGQIMLRVSRVTEVESKGSQSHGQMLAGNTGSGEHDMFEITEIHVRDMVKKMPARECGDDGLPKRKSESFVLDRTDPSEAMIARKVRPLVIAQRVRRTRSRCMDGSLDHNNVVGLAMSEPDVFRQKSSARGVNTALMVLMDQSGSTKGIIGLLGRVSYRLTEISLGVPDLKTAFMTYTSHWVRHSGQCKALVMEVRGFDDGPTTARQNFELWARSNKEMNGTPTAEATLAAARHLEQRKERRRILLTITDGRPDDMDATVAANEHLRSRGIETCVLEIGEHREPMTSYEMTRVAKNMGEVPDALHSMFKSLLGNTR